MKKIPMKAYLAEALKDFRQALVKQGVYSANHQNLHRACNGARDFVDFLVEGPGALRKGRRREK